MVARLCTPLLILTDRITAVRRNLHTSVTPHGHDCRQQLITYLPSLFHCSNVCRPSLVIFGNSLFTLEFTQNHDFVHQNRLDRNEDQNAKSVTWYIRVHYSNGID